MKLYFSAGSCALASQIALRETDQTNFELIRMDFASKRTVEGDYYQVNPKGLIPALKLDNGDVITEGAVILQWIADQRPEYNLLPAFGTKERYEALTWLNFIATDMHKGMGNLFSTLLDEESKTKWAAEVMIGKFEFIEKHLSENDYLMGDKFCVADAYLYNVMRWPARLNMDLSKYTGIKRFMTRMEERPAVKAAIKGEGLKF